MAHERMQRINEQLKKEVGRIIQDELNDPRVGFVTITKVDVTADLQQARVYFSVLGTDKQKRDTRVGLSRSAGFIRKLVGQKVKLRYTPKILFKLEESAEYSVRISEVLDEIKQKEKGKKNEHQQSS